MVTKKKSAGSDELRLSPSSINTFFKCPRLFYYTYILKKRAPPNIHLYKGTFIHNVLEKLFLNSKHVDLDSYMRLSMTKWKIPAKMVSNQEEAAFHRLEAEKMLKMFANRFDEKLDMIILEGKARDKNHAWNLIKPKLREFKIYDKELHLVGIIDSVENSYDNMVYLIDYKTSKLYRHILPEDYIRQTRIYAYLYYKEFGKLPNYLGVHYLRYGEVFIIPVTDNMLGQVIQDVATVRNGIKSKNIEDYPKCNFDWCDCNYFEKKIVEEVNIDDEEESTD